MTHDVSTWALLAILLLVQNASFTFVSRARNSGSYLLHAVAAMISNGVWISGQFVSLGIILDALKSGSLGEKAFVAVFYTTFTVSGAVAMHWIGVNYIERGKRKVGA